MRLNNDLYDVLKWITMIVLPALGTLYFALSQIWGLPYGEQIIGTISAVTVFMGAVLGVSTKSYNALEEQNAQGKEWDNPFGDYDVEDTIEEGDEDADS